MSQTIFSQTTIIIAIVIVFILILLIYYNYWNKNDTNATTQEGGAATSTALIEYDPTASNNNSSQSEQQLSPVGADESINYAQLSQKSEDNSNDVKNTEFNLDDLLPVENNDNDEWGLNAIKVADSKLINVNRCMGAMTTKKCCTRDFRGDIPIKKDANLMWNLSPIEPGDLIERSP